MSFFSSIHSPCLALDFEGSPQVGDDAKCRLAPKKFSVAQLERTRLCRYYSKACRNGNACPFAHGEHELEKRPDLTKTSLCKAWLAGTPCTPDCSFAHGRQELRGAVNSQGLTGPSSVEVARANRNSASHRAGKRCSQKPKSNWPKVAVADGLCTSQPAPMQTSVVEPKAQLVDLSTAVEVGPSNPCSSTDTGSCRSMAASLADFGMPGHTVTNPNGFSSSALPQINADYDEVSNWQYQQQESLDRDHVIHLLLANLSSGNGSQMDSQCATMAMLEHLLILAQPKHYED